MDDIFKTRGYPGMPCPVMPLADKTAVPVAVASTLARSVADSPRGIEFGVLLRTDAVSGNPVPIPGYDAPALPLKPVRDPSLSLVALSGIEPSGAQMTEVPQVQNTATSTVEQVLTGRRVGFADRFVRGSRHEPVEHSVAFLKALDVLRLAGAQLVPVPAQRVDAALHFNLHTRNEIDEHMSEYRLDALVSDSHTAAFHAACWRGYPSLGEPLEGGATLCFYGARWSRDSLVVLVQAYRLAMDFSRWPNPPRR